MRHRQKTHGGGSLGRKRPAQVTPETGGGLGGRGWEGTGDRSHGGGASHWGDGTIQKQMEMTAGTGQGPSP